MHTLPVLKFLPDFASLEAEEQTPTLPAPPPLESTDVPQDHTTAAPPPHDPYQEGMAEGLKSGAKAHEEALKAQEIALKQGFETEKKALLQGLIGDFFDQHTAQMEAFKREISDHVGIILQPLVVAHLEEKALSSLMALLEGLTLPKQTPIKIHGPPLLLDALKARMAQAGYEMIGWEERDDIDVVIEADHTALQTALHKWALEFLPLPQGSPHVRDGG